MIFHHKARQASIVQGSVLYIDGGELSQRNGTGTGLYNESTITTSNDTNTYAIDLSVSWINRTVAITTVSTAGQGVVSHALWPGVSQDTFHSYDGGASLAIAPLPNVPANQLWSFNTTGSSHQWSREAVSGNFSTLVRVQEGIYAGGNGLGFAVGGIRNGGTIQNVIGSRTDIAEYVEGMVMYNASSKSWYNITIPSNIPYAANSSNGAAHFLPNFGPEGLLMLFGGIRPDDSLIDLQSAVVFEPVSQQWRTQTVTGVIPEAVQNPCVVGAPGDSGTYEIFLYGGLKSNHNGWKFSDGSMYVLSLPAFHWSSYPSHALGRYRHSCNRNGGQMISIGGMVATGGINSFNANDEDTGGPDPWPNGIGVYDMHNLQWKTGYDGANTSYVTPDAVKSLNAQQPSMTFDDPTLQNWFASMRTDPTTNANASTTSAAAPTSSASSASSPSPVSAGTIAGAVVGAVVGLALLALCVLWLLRRRSHLKQLRAGLASSSSPNLVKSSPELRDNGMSELECDRRPEIDGQPRSELANTQRTERRELA